MRFNLNETDAAKRRFWVFLVQDADGKTPATGEEGGNPQISKNGGAFDQTENELVHIGNGSYFVELTQDELDTAGKIIIRYKSGNTLEFSLVADVEPEPINTGVGLHSVTITISSESVPLTGVQVTIRNTDETSLVAWGITDIDGEIGFSIDPGTYHVLIRSNPHYEPLPAQVLVVGGVTEQEYVLTQQTPAPPPAVEGFCRVLMTVIGPDGLPAADVLAEFTLMIEGAAEVDGNRFLTFFSISARTNTNGQLLDPKTQEIGVIIMRTDYIFPHITQVKKWKIEVPACRLTGAAAFFKVVEEDVIDLGEVLPAA